MKPKARAYSYLRFSTPEQLKGDSFRRQIELSRRYAKKHELDLDESLTFQDLGVSAYRGRNLKEGALRDFVEALERDIVPSGSYLLVESLDRLSRSKVHDAYSQFTDILNRGINIVTLQDNKLYTKDSINENFSDLIISLATMFRAHEESQTKSKRLKSAWKNKRKLAQESGIKLTGLAPAWLQFNKKTGAFAVHKDRAAIIKRIFKMTIDGLGKRQIALKFNEDGIPPFGRSKGWQPSYIQKILNNEAVIGRFQPMQTVYTGGKKKRIPEGDTIDDYFPSVIKPETFLKAKNIRTMRYIGGGRKGSKFSNLFSGIAECGACGASMHYINKGSGPKGGAYLVCANARNKSNNCKSYSWRYLAVQSVIIMGLNEVDFRELYPAIFKSGRTKLKELEDRLLVKNEELERTKVKIDNAVELLVSMPDSSAMQQKLTELESTANVLEQEIGDIDRKLSEKKDGLDAFHDTEGLDEALDNLLRAEEQGNDEELFVQRSRLNQLLKRYIQSIKMTPAEGALEPKFGSDLHGVIDVTFSEIEGHHRRFYFEKGQKNAYGYRVSGKKESHHTSHIDINWPPDGVITMGPFLEPDILGSVK